MLAMVQQIIHICGSTNTRQIKSRCPRMLESGKALRHRKVRATMISLAPTKTEQYARRKGAKTLKPNPSTPSPSSIVVSNGTSQYLKRSKDRPFKMKSSLPTLLPPSQSS